MTKLNGWKTGSVVFLLLLVVAIAAPAQMFTKLVNFEGANGAGPYFTSLVQGADGGLYGVTFGGGPNNDGTVFKISSERTLQTIYSFCSQPNCTDGAYPAAPLVLASDGSFYGTTSAGGNPSCGANGGCGTIFKVTPTGGLSTLFTFCAHDNCAEGYVPFSGLIQAIDGNFYGMTTGGGNSSCYRNTGCGLVFKISPEGDFAVVHSFIGTDGAFPYGDLVQGTSGDIYGTTLGFPISDGSIFRTTTSGVVATVQLERTSIGLPFAGLVQATDGNFYGTAEGSANGGGAVFSVTPNGTLTVLYSFCSLRSCADGKMPQAPLAQGTDGNLYGMTREGGDITCNAPTGCGTVFQISPAGVLTTVHTFENADGTSPYDGLVQATNGSFYGVTPTGGDLTCAPPYGCGTIFRLDMGLGPFVTFVRASGKAGQTGGILGQGFTGTTGVTLNGIPASFTVVSDTFIKATVPTGATTGYVTVTTPTGVLTSNVPFHVIP